MSYFLTLLNLALAFIRIPEYYPELASYRIIFWLGIVSLIFSLFSLVVGPRPTFKARQIYLMLLFVGTVAMSLVATGWLGGALYAFQQFGSTLTYFLLIVLNITTLSRVRAVAVLLVVSCLIMVGQGVLALEYGFMPEKFLYLQRLDSSGELTEVTDVSDDSGTPYGGSDAPTGPVMPRIRNIGFLNDPNDLAQVLLVAIPFAALAWRRRQAFRNLCLVVLPIGILLYGVLLTRSRGGVVGLAVLCLLAFRERLGKVRAGIITGILVAGLLAMNIASGRGFSSSESSAQGRIEAWSSGLLMLRERPVFGVGYKNFTEEHPGLTAHNSFVLCFSELGLVGYFVWMSLLVVTLMELTALMKLPGTDPDTLNIHRWSKAIRLALVTFLTAAFFLSRTYIMTLYMLLGLAVAVAEVARRTTNLQFTPTWQRLNKTVMTGIATSIVLVWVLVKLGS